VNKINLFIHLFPSGRIRLSLEATSMSLFSRFRRSSTAVDRYVNLPASHVYPSSARPRHARHERQPFAAGGTYSHAVSVESIPYLPSENTRGTASEVSLRSEYSQLDNDTSRYPKWSASTSSAPSSTDKRRVQRQRETPNSARQSIAEYHSFSILP
jgi:hypothetical protein